MSDKPESEEPASAPPGVRKKNQPPSFDEVMAGLGEREPQPQRRSEPPPPKKPTQPSFEDILASAGTDPAPTQRPQREERRPRQQKKDERKMPIVVRKPTLGAQPSQPPPQETQSSASSEPSAPRPSQPMPESQFAQPSSEESADFGALFAETSSRRPDKLKPGSKVSGRIAHLGGEVAFLDLGGKGEGIIDLRELRNEKGDLLVHVGERIEGYVLSLADGNVVVTRSVPKGAGREIIQQAMDAKAPIEGLVTAQNKGGLEVDLGGMRAFVPASQIDIRFVEDTAQFVGQKLKFRITELRGGNAILSRRALLEEERAGKALQLREQLHVGAQLEGEVTGVRDFGAFVDLGGLEGLIHVSELSHQRVAHAQDVVKQGQKVKVQVLRIEKDEKGHERIALSLRALAQDPWEAARPQIKEGMRMKGKVVRLQPFGAFVELFPGVDGLVHVSALADRHVLHPRDVVQEGEEIFVHVDSIDDQSKRISLRRISEDEAAAPASVEKPADKQKRPRVGDMVDATVDKCESFGVFVHWDGGKGLIPNAELGTPHGSDNKKTTPVGTQLKAQIVDLDERGRYRLSRTSAERTANRNDYLEYQREQKKKGKGFGTLGDLLRAKLEQTDEE